MQTKKQFFSHNKNLKYNHRIGTYKTKSSTTSIILPFLAFMVLASLSATGYWIFNKQAVVLSQENTASSSGIEQTQLDKARFDEKSYQAFEDDKLANTIKNNLKTMPKDTKWAVTVRNIKTGQMANINSDVSMPSASLYKLFLLAPLEEKTQAKYWNRYLNKYSINDCVIAMLKVSDNDCAEAIGKYANWNKAQDYNNSIGFSSTNLIVEQQMTTSKDVAELMYRLQTSKILTDKARRVVFDALYEQKYTEGIPKGCGKNCLVANKTGEIDNIKNDAAIVTHGNNKYVLVIMSQNTTWQQIADLTKFIDSELLP